MKAMTHGTPLGSRDERGPSLRDLVRTIRLSFGYRSAIAATLACAAIFSACRYVKTWLAKPFLDEVLIPSMGAAGLDRADLWSRAGDILGIVALTLLLSPPALFFRLYFASWVAGRTRRDVDTRVAQKFLAAPLRRHRGESSGEMLSRALTDAHLAVRTIEVLYKDVVEDLMLLIGGVIAMFLLSWQLSLMSLGAVPILLGTLGYFGNQIQKKSQRRQESQSDLSQRLIAILSGIKVIKAFQGQDLELGAFARETQTYFKRHMKVVVQRGYAKTTSDSVNQVVGAAILGVGGYFVLEGMFGLTMGTLSAFALVMAQVYKPIKSLTVSYTTIMESNAGAQRLFEVFDMEEDVPDRPNAQEMRGLTQGIRFRDVHFDYGQGTILQGIDLEVKPGEVIAIVGRTGTGKSTLMDLLLRFHDPTRGSIEIDGVDLRDLKRKSFLSHVAVVTQEPLPLRRLDPREHPLREAPGDHGRGARRRRRRVGGRVHRRAAAGATTRPSASSGSASPGGQRQRITIARAILADPTILVFDEATSSPRRQDRARRAARDRVPARRADDLPRRPPPDDDPPRRSHRRPRRRPDRRRRRSRNPGVAAGDLPRADRRRSERLGVERLDEGRMALGGRIAPGHRAAQRLPSPGGAPDPGSAARALRPGPPDPRRPGSRSRRRRRSPGSLLGA
jgi:ABC-type multidrug transport system fused ATPase/permease subunit